jgi:diguanylate cyclase (GGDEF)-like protein
VTLRSRLALFFLGVVVVPMVVAVVLADDQTHAQAIRDADLTLRLAAVTATDSLQRERAGMAQSVNPSFALRAFTATSPSGLDALRRSAHLDYVVVIRHGLVATASIALPSGIDESGEAIDRGALRLVAAERRVVIRRADGASVLGGRLWLPRLGGLGVDAVLVVDGTSLGDHTAIQSVSARPTSARGARMVCLCRRDPQTAGLLLSVPVPPHDLARWVRWPRLGLVLVWIAAVVGIAYLLAGLLTRPLRRLAQGATAIAHGETGAVIVPDPAADREIHHVMSSLRLVSEELSGSRGELERTKGRLVDTERMILVDPLTGVWNRRYLDHALLDQTKRYTRWGHPFALLLIDVDRFKRINDAHGHVAGDAVLKGIAGTIERSIRSPVDILVRFGGEEFIAVLPETDSRGGLAAAEKIRRLLHGSTFDTGSTAVSVTVSVGVAACPRDGTDADELLDAADGALYRAKRAGRNRVASASDPPQPAQEA